MKRIKTGLLLGIGAGIIDVIPMILQNLDWYSNMSAFFFWVAMGIIIPNVDLALKGWIKGIVISELSALSLFILVFKQEPMSVIPMIIMSLILGSIIGYLGDKYGCKERN